MHTIIAKESGFNTLILTPVFGFEIEQNISRLRWDYDYSGCQCFSGMKKDTLNVWINYEILGFLSVVFHKFNTFFNHFVFRAMKTIIEA